MSIFDYYNIRADTPHFIDEKIISDGRRKKSKCFYKDFLTLDTETSFYKTEDDYVAYIYQWSICSQNNIRYGRTPTSLIQFLKELRDYYRISENNINLVVYVHNLSYDIQYLKNFFKELGEVEYIATRPHKYLTFSVSGFIFRCSYMLTNKSLQKFGKDMNVKYPKLVGAIDYKTFRTQTSKLFRKDWLYMFRDVISLHQSIEKQLEIHNDNVITIPLTATGYVRRVCRNSFKADEKNKIQFQKNRLNEETYTICRRAFSGALTHANRFKVNQTIKGKIRHRDFTSHYPTQQICKKEFPATPFKLLGENLSFEDLKRYKDEYCYILEIEIENISIKDTSITLPYLQEEKVRLGCLRKDFISTDNGRVLQFKGVTTLYYTNIDIEILLEQYDIEFYNIKKCYISRKGYLPEWLRKSIFEFFYNKCNIKELLKTDNNTNLKIEYMLAKAFLNAIYGMSATDIVRPEYKFNEELMEWQLIKPDINNALNKYYHNYNSFMSYQFGCFTTALARQELIRVIKIIGWDNFLYADTDSAFYISTDEIEEKLNKLNDEWYKECIQNNHYVTTEQGNIYTFHNFTDENEDIIAFRTLHSKCYAYVLNDKDKTLHCTIAGVSRKNGKVTREQELGDIAKLDFGKTFIKCGGNKILYGENDIYYDKYNNIVSSFALIVPTTKTLNPIKLKEYSDDFYFEPNYIDY